MGVYKITRPDGSIEYSDMPGGAGRVEPVGSDGTRAYDHKQVKDIIKEVQKRVPKLNDYLEYLEYLRNHRPYQLDRVLQELRKEDPQTWLKLQKYPQFKPLNQTALGLKATETHLGPGIAVIAAQVTGSYGGVTGSVEKWLETTVKDMMKRDRYGPYAPVLGSKASTLPASKSPTYSDSRLGQYLKTEDARSLEAAKRSAKAMEASRAAVRTAKATAVTRGLNPLLDLGIGASDIDFFKGVSAIQGMRLGKELVEKGVLTQEEALELRGMMARAEFGKARELIEAGAQRAGERK